MAWVRLDDEFDEHPKIAQVGAIGAWLQIQALCYCNRNLTDGFIPTSIAESFVARGSIRVDERNVQWTLGEHSGMQGLDLGDVAWPARMVEAGLWELVPHGYRIHDFEHYQPTKAEVLAERERSRSRQAKHRHGGSHGVTPPELRRNSVGPVPVPVPGSQISLPSVTQGDATSPRPTELGFDRFWAAYPKKRHKPDAVRAWRGADGARHLEAILAGLERWRRSEAWGEGFVEDPATFLRQRQWEDEPARATPRREPGGRVVPSVEATRERLRHL